MPRPDAVVFDLYDTLVWSDWPAHATFLAGKFGVGAETVLAAYHHLRESRDSGGLTDTVAVLAAVAEYCGVEASPDDLEQLAGTEAEFLAESVTLYDDSLPVLRALRDQGVATAVLSNCSPSTRPVVDHLRLADEADAVVLSCEAGTSKPSPGIYRIALDALGATPGQSWFVDDRRDYLDGARTVGMQTARIERHVAFGEDIAGGDHPVITGLDQLFELF